MTYRKQTNERGEVIGYRNSETGEVVSAKEFEKQMQMQQVHHQPTMHQPMMPAAPMAMNQPHQVHIPGEGVFHATDGVQPRIPHGMSGTPGGVAGQPMTSGMHQPYAPGIAQPVMPSHNPHSSPLVQPGAQLLTPQHKASLPGMPQSASAPGGAHAPLPGTMLGGHHPANAVPSTIDDPTQGKPPTSGAKVQGKSLRLEGIPKAHPQQHSKAHQKRAHGFLDATSVAILLPTLVLLALIIAAAHKKRLFPWQTIRTFNPPSGLLTPRDYERSYLCPPNLRRHGRMGKRNPNATWTDEDGVVVPFGFLARTHLPITIPMGRLPNKNMFVVAPSGSGKTTLMRAIIKSLLAKPCVIIALEAKANDPNLDEKKEGFKYTVLPEAQHAGFNTLYFNPLDQDSIHWNPLDLSPIQFASSIVQDINALDAEEQHWAERDMGYIEGLCQLLKWGAVQVVKEDENGSASEFEPIPCNPRGLMKLVNNRRNIVESLRQLKGRSDVNATELSELTQRLSSIIRTDNDWDKNIQGVRGRLRMFKNEGIMRVTEKSNIKMNDVMHSPSVLIFGAPASLGPDAESLAACFVHQLQQALHTRYGTKSVLPLFAFFDEYQTLNIDLAGRLSAIVRGANGGLTVILQNISQITSGGSAAQAEAELRTIFSNSAIRVCLHNADEQTAAFFSEEVGKHAVIVPGIADHYQATGFGIFPTSWNRIHSQQVVARVDPDGIKRMEKHHALVYLAPAGDPEFGETKPFMVDLRGIEEIARLHLLHNVTSRNEGGSGAPGAAPGGAGQPAFASVTHPADAINTAFSEPGQGEQVPPGANSGQVPQNLGEGQEVPSMAKQVTDAAQQVIGQLFGKPGESEATPAMAGAGAGGQGGGAPFAQVPGAVNALGNASRTSMEAGGASAQGQPQASRPAASPGFAGVPGNMPSRPGSNAMAATSGAPQAMNPATGMPTPTPAQAVPVESGPRDCPHCGQHAGKGKFCIECGKFIGANAPAAGGAANAQKIVGPMGSRPENPSKPMPRHGGLDVTDRSQMPSKKEPDSMQQKAQNVAGGANPFARPGGGLTGMGGAGPLSQRVAEANQQVEAQSQGTASADENQRTPVTSLKPDISKFGFAQNIQQNTQQNGQQDKSNKNPGVEF